MRPLTAVELEVVETLIIDLEEGIEDIARVIGEDEPPVPALQAALDWLRAIHSVGIIVFDPPKGR